MKEVALIPTQEKKIDFYGDEIVAVLTEVEDQRQVYVPIKPLCDYLGLSWSSQLQRLKRDEVLSEALSNVSLMDTKAGQRYTVICLALEFLPGWLFGITTSRVRADLQAKITRYRRECYRILWQAFQADVLTMLDTEIEEMPSSSTELMQIRDMGLAIARMAEQQLAQEQKLTATNKRLDVAGAIIKRMDGRLTDVERRLSPPHYVTEEMAADIMAAVKALAEQLAKRDKSKNHYQAVYAEIYRRYRAASYTQIHIDKYEDVMRFLADWQESLGRE